jgi:coenzyme F420-reducing hydrogenase delta subunit
MIDRNNYNIKGLISSIYECQKRIIINRRFIREYEADGRDVRKLRDEIKEMENKISEFQTQLRKQYRLTY